VQTPLRKTKEPDISNILNACRGLAKRLRKGALVVLESTTYPGTTEEAVRPELEKSGLKAGKDFFLAFSPERVDPGNTRWKIENTPKVVGGLGPESTRRAVELYSQVIAQVVPVSNTTAAELVKLLENTFRSVNIALVNELAQICDRLGLDVWEIVGAAATKPFGFMPFWPGPGIGGHCIPKDPHLLSWKMRSLNFEPRFIELATTINGGMPVYAASRVARCLNKDGKAVKGSRVLVLGAAYKPGVGDFRDSPSLDIMHLLAEDGAVVDYHDPFVPKVSAGGRAWRSKPLTDALVKRADCVAILTAHAGIDYARVCRTARRVFDARNATRGLKGRVERL
jgi:UDP-N-acetyl-D-glucosamine dehydrogenase